MKKTAFSFLLDGERYQVKADGVAYLVGGDIIEEVEKVEKGGIQQQPDKR